MARQDSRSDQRNRAGLSSRSDILLAIAFFTAFVIAAILGRYYFVSQRGDIVARKGVELAAVRDLKIEQILEWRAGLLRDGQALGADPALRGEADRWLSDPNDSEAEAALRAAMSVLVKTRGYSDAVMISADGARWISLSGDTPPDATQRKEGKAALASGEATLTDIFVDPQNGQPRLDVLAPLTAAGDQARAVVVLGRDPHKYLFPLLQRWPSPSPSSETLLVRRDGNAVLFLNELRFKAGTALHLKIPFSIRTLLAVQAVMGPARVTEGTDYRGIPVYGAVGRVGDTPWYIVTKVDKTEAFAGVFESQMMVVVAVVVVLVIMGLGLLLAWRQRAVEYYRAKLETERSEHLLSQQYGVLTRYSSDAVFLTDERLNIVQANERAAALYGFSVAELLSMSLGDLLDPSGIPQEMPVADVFRDAGGRIDEVRQRRKDGSLIDTEMSIESVVSDEDTMYVAITRDITERKASENALRASEQRFRSIVESSPTAIYLYHLEPDDRLVLQSANPASDSIIGIDHSTLIGLTIEEAFPHLIGTEIPDLYRAVARGELEPQSFEIPYEDDRFSGYYAVTVFQTGPDLVAVDFVDISDRRRAEEELRHRTEELVQSNAQLEKFAYIASHDLQEPLRMVASYTQLLQRRYQGQLDQDADDFIAFAVDGATRMQVLINELLTYSRIGTQGAELVEADLEDVLGDVLKTLEIAASEGQAVITHDPMPVVVCDPVQIGQVFQNLIANAIKFRGENPPAIHVGAQRADDEWVLSVRDNGLGVEKEYFERIFVIFQRLQSRSEYPGTGMGLAICKRIVERHGGRIWVESEPGEGSTFYFSLRDQGDDPRAG